jgi:hypothetical protein
MTGGPYAPVDDAVFPGGRPFDEVRVDPRDGMVVHFAPPPEPRAEGTGWPQASDDGPAPEAVSGEASGTEWHPHGHEGAPRQHDEAPEPEPPGGLGS